MKRYEECNDKIKKFWDEYWELNKNNENLIRQNKNLKKEINTLTTKIMNIKNKDEEKIMNIVNEKIKNIIEENNKKIEVIQNQNKSLIKENKDWNEKFQKLKEEKDNEIIKLNETIKNKENIIQTNIEEKN